MLWNIYVVRNNVIAPTCAKAEAGFGVEVEPVFTAPIGDVAGAADAIAQSIRSGNPIVPTPDWRKRKNPILGPAGVRSWSAFMKRAACWCITKSAGTYAITPYKKVTLDGSLVLQSDTERGVAVPDLGDIQLVAREILEIISGGHSDGHT